MQHAAWYLYQECSAILDDIPELIGTYPSLAAVWAEAYRQNVHVHEAARDDPDWGDAEAYPHPRDYHRAAVRQVTAPYSGPTPVSFAMPEEHSVTAPTPVWICVVDTTTLWTSYMKLEQIWETAQE